MRGRITLAYSFQKMRLFTSSTFLLVLISTATLQSQPQSENPEPPDSSQLEEEVEEEVEEESIVDEAHENISKGVLATANWLDAFFDDSRFQLETNKSRIKTSFTTLLEKGEGIEFKAKAKLRLALPRFKNKLHLLVLAEPDDEITTGSNNRIERRFRSQTPTRDQDSFATALQYFMKETPLSNLSLLTGFKIRANTPAAFFGPRYRHIIELNSWTARFTQSLRWFTDEGLESRTRIDFEKPFLQDKLFFRTTAQGEWSEDEDGYFYDLKFLVFQPVSEKQSLSYEWNNLFQTRPNNRLEEINLGVRYRQRFWRKWLFYEVGPQYSFPQEKDYDFVPGIMFKLDVILGHY